MLRSLILVERAWSTRVTATNVEIRARFRGLREIKGSAFVSVAYAVESCYSSGFVAELVDRVELEVWMIGLAWLEIHQELNDSQGGILNLRLLWGFQLEVQIP